MKKSLLALAALATLAGAASAQSSVTLSGSVDLGVKREGTGPDGNVDTNWSMGNAGSGRNAITFAGVEDLGGGLKAFFLANHRFRTEDGTVNSAVGFWRQSWVGLGGGFGDIRLGKMLVPLQDFNGQYEAWDGGDTVGNVHTGGIGAAALNNARTNSTVYYRSPSLGGATIHASVADAGANGGAGVADAKKPVGLGVKFDSGPLSVAVAGDRTALDIATLGVYAKYNFGFATLFGQFERGDNADDTEKVKRWSLSTTVPVGAAAIKAGYTRWKDEDISKFGLGADYNLSKRTRLYSDLGKIRGDGASEAAKKLKFDLGIQHKF